MAEAGTDRRELRPARARVASMPFLLAIRAYQLTLGTFMGGQCRFYPTCSHYAMEAYQRHGPVRGTWLTTRRIARCHPFGGGGYDPVPPGPRRSEAPSTGVSPNLPRPDGSGLAPPGK